MSRALPSGASLAVEAVTREVLGAFGKHGVGSVLLKGAPLARRLYDDPSHRGSGDVDLLVREIELPAAREALANLGFRRTAWDAQKRRLHAELWLRAPSAVTVDLHLTLPGVGAQPDELFDALASHTRTEALGDISVPVPDGPAFAFVVAVHAAAHGRESGKPLRDLELALAKLPPRDWDDAAALAERLDAVAAFRAGLALVGGQSIGDAPPEVALRAASAPHTALGFARLARRKGIRQKLQHTIKTAFPPPEVVRGWHPIASRGRLGLSAAYAFRLMWLARWAPAGFRAWLRARSGSLGTGRSS